MEDINILIAFAAGLLSFLSPCVLPLLPSYVSYVTGVSLDELRDDQLPRRREVVGRTVMFVMGFSLVFVALGIVFSGSAVLVGGLAAGVNLVAGGIVIILGLNVIFDFASFLNRERRVHMSERPRGYAGSAAVGMAFGAGWTPCIGPVLASILFMAGTSTGVAAGAVLLLTYSLGLGLPFLLASVFFAPTLRYLERIKPWLATLKTLTGMLLIGIGVLIAGGQLQNLQATLFRAATAIEGWAQRSPVAALWIPGMLVTALAILPVVRPLRALRSTGNRAATPNRTPADTTPVLRTMVSPWRIVISLLFLTFAVLHFADILPITRALSLWFTYEGI